MVSELLKRTNGQKEQKTITENMALLKEKSLPANTIIISTKTQEFGWVKNSGGTR
jgi:hypothetical protein